MSPQHPLAKRIPKTLTQKLADLDDHLFLLSHHLHCLQEDQAHLKVIAAELRTLVCFSSRTEGLLWRLVDELDVSDLVHLHAFEGVKHDHPRARGLHFVAVPLYRAGEGPPGLPPAAFYPLRDILKTFEAVFVAGKGLTHEYLIKAIAQQMGSAHESDDVEPALVDMGQIFVNGVQPYIPVLALDGELTLEVGGRVLRDAQVKAGYQPKARELKTAAP